MSKQKTAALLLSLGLCTVALPALAEPWFEKYDKDHDGRWTYKDFSKAHHEWIKRHHEEKALSEKQLRDQWHTLDKDRHGYVREEQVRSFHHWD